MMTFSRQSSPSRSIPIHPNGDSTRWSREEAQQREAAMADYVDFCFASRLVSGMQKRQSYTHDVSLRYENQAVIDRIIATRQNRSDDDEAFPTTRRYSSPPRRDSNEMLKGGRVEDDMIFDMEL